MAIIHRQLAIMGPNDPRARLLVVESIGDPSQPVLVVVAIGVG